MIDKILNPSNPVNDFQVKPVEGVSKVKEVKPENQDQAQPQANTKEKTEKVINSMNEFLKASNSHLKFEFHEKLQEYFVTIVDDSTNEVIKEVPSKKLLDMYAAMTEYIGLLVDKKG